MAANYCETFQFAPPSCLPHPVLQGLSSDLWNKLYPARGCNMTSTWTTGDKAECQLFVWRKNNHVVSRQLPQLCLDLWGLQGTVGLKMSISALVSFPISMAKKETSQKQHNRSRVCLAHSSRLQSLWDVTVAGTQHSWAKRMNECMLVLSPSALPPTYAAQDLLPRKWRRPQWAFHTNWHNQDSLP